MKDVRILLANPEGAVNLGFIARAMANTGFSGLFLSGKLNPMNPTALKYALAAENILRDTVRCSGFDDLISHADKIVGVSMRTPETSHANIDLCGLNAYINDCREKGLTVGLLFGNEKAGLSNTQLASCAKYISLDTSDTFPSMNLAQAVLVVLWQIKDIPPKETAETEFAGRKLHDALNKKIEQFLNMFGCLNPQNPEKIMNEIRQAAESKVFTARETELILSVLGKAMAEHNILLKKTGKI